MERLWLCLFLLTGAQGLSMYEDYGLRENPGDAGKSESVTKNNFNLIPYIYNKYVSQISDSTFCCWVNVLFLYLITVHWLCFSFYCAKNELPPFASDLHQISNIYIIKLLHKFNNYWS